MSVEALSYTFLFLVVLNTLLRYSLAIRQQAHVQAHRQAVPPAFASRIALHDHQKAADYSCAKLRAARLEMLIDSVLLLALTLGGGLTLIDRQLQATTTDYLAHGLGLFVALSVISGLFGLPFSLYRTFVIEEQFGFNKMTWSLWLIDAIKGLALAALLGLPLLAAALWLMQSMGDHWWLYTWMVWFSFNLLLLWLYPTVIAPLFNKFQPLDDASIRERISALLKRCGFSSSGLFVMDGSKRSAHGNAYFTGLGKAKRIVFFDTLLKSLAPAEVEAVLAHELGHFHHRHILKRIVFAGLSSLAFLWVLSLLINEPSFYATTGVDAGGTAMGLLLFSLVVPVVLFPLTPLSSFFSRRQEFEADAYAARQTSADDLVSALVKLYQENAATLTPDPLHSMFYDSHPPASLRIQHLESFGSTAAVAVR